MANNNQSFYMFRGDTKYIYVTVTDNKGSAVDLTNHTAEWQLIRKSNPIITKSIGSGIEILDPVKGKIRITLSSTDTKDLLGDHHQVLRIIDSNSNIFTVTTGTISFDRVGD